MMGKSTGGFIIGMSNIGLRQMTKRIEGPQDPKLELPREEKCVRCLDETLVRGIGYLVCPGCDWVKPNMPVRLQDDLDSYRVDI